MAGEFVFGLLNCHIKFSRCGCSRQQREFLIWFCYVITIPPPCADIFYKRQWRRDDFACNPHVCTVGIACCTVPYPFSGWCKRLIQTFFFASWIHCFFLRRKIILERFCSMLFDSFFDCKARKNSACQIVRPRCFLSYISPIYQFTVCRLPSVWQRVATRLAAIKQTGRT